MINGNYTEIGGFKCLNFIFEERDARIIFPNTEKNGKWLLKTEYADAFMDTEFELINRGYCCAFLSNRSRWGLKEDLERKSRFIKFLSEEFGLNKKCALIGMSCGGLMAIKQAAFNSEDIACLYLDVSACEHVLYVPALAILLEEPQLCSIALILGSALELVCHVVLYKHRIVPDGIGYAVYATVLRESLRTCCQYTDKNRNE